MPLPIPWLGPDRGYLSDWVTQTWVRATGRRLAPAGEQWLEGPIGDTRGIGQDYFTTLAAEAGLELRRNQAGSGLLSDFGALAHDAFPVERVDPRIVEFYENTSRYDFDVWSEWCGWFRPFGRLLALIFSRRLQQLNVPLSPLDTSRGITSEILQLMDPFTGEVRYTGWLRRLVGSGEVLYAGCYSLCLVPGHPGICLKVVFPLPNGNATVIMRPEVHEDGSFTVTSAGDKFGDPGFYFVVHRQPDRWWARYVRTLRESIHIYRDAAGVVRADHVLRIWGAVFLRLHYRLQAR